MNGVSLFPDLSRGLEELVRVTNPGGTVLLVAQDPPQNVEFLGFILTAMRAVVPGFTGPPMDPPLLPFQFADTRKLRQHMTDAGQTHVRVKIRTWRMEFQSGSHMW